MFLYLNIFFYFFLYIHILVMNHFLPFESYFDRCYSLNDKISLENQSFQFGS